MEGLDAIEKNHAFKSYEVEVPGLLLWLQKGSERVYCQGLSTASLQNGEKAEKPVIECLFW